MPFDTVVVPYLAVLAVACFASVLSLRAERPRPSAIVALVFALIGAAVTAYGCWIIANRAGSARMLRYLLAYGGLLLPPTLIGLVRSLSSGGAVAPGEHAVVRTSSRRERRLVYSWAIWGAVGLFALVVGFVLSWADKH